MQLFGLPFELRYSIKSFLPESPKINTNVRHLPRLHRRHDGIVLPGEEKCAQWWYKAGFYEPEPHTLYEEMVIAANGGKCFDLRYNTIIYQQILKMRRSYNQNVITETYEKFYSSE